MHALAEPIPGLAGEFWMVTHADLKATARVRAFFDIRCQPWPEIDQPRYLCPDGRQLRAVSDYDETMVGALQREYYGNSGFFNFGYWTPDTRSQRAPARLRARFRSAALGSTRDKPDDAYCAKILDGCRANDIRYFFYIGGNDSADTCRIVSEKAAASCYELRCFHVPKTVDNDLPITDCCPGFGSVAKYVAVSTREAGLDVEAAVDERHCLGAGLVPVYRRSGRSA